MRHAYYCPLRWADMDMLGHVNNVTYVDYLQEARIDMLAAHAPMRGGEELAEGVVVVRHEVDFVAPLVFRAAPVRIECWVTEIRAATFTMAYEILDELPDGTRRVYLRARSVLAPYVFSEERPRRIRAEERAVLERFIEPHHPPGEPSGRRRTPRAPAVPAHEYELRVRFSDVDAYGHVNNVKYFEFLQESRLVFLGDLGQPGEEFMGHIVVARVDVDYQRPILFRIDPYRVVSWVSRVGTSSFTIGSEMRDGDALLARGQAVLVGFDTGTQRSVPLTGGQRGRLHAVSGG